MASNPLGDAELRQALDSLFEQLRQEGRSRFRDALKLGHFEDEHSPPETLAPPFSVQPWTRGERQTRDVLALLVLGAIVLAPQWWKKGADALWLSFVLAVISGVRLHQLWRRHRSWFFMGRKPKFVPYTQVVGAEEKVLPAQHRRRGGTVVVWHQPAPGAGRLAMTLPDVPDAERLVRWLQTLSKAPPTDAPLSTVVPPSRLQSSDRRAVKQRV